MTISKMYGTAVIIFFCSSLFILLFTLFPFTFPGILHLFFREALDRSHCFL